MSDSNFEFNYNEETDTLVVKDIDKTEIFKIGKNKYGKLFRYMVKSIDELSNSQPVDPNYFNVDLMPISYTASGSGWLASINISSYITDGVFIPFQEDDTYTVEFDGVTYENLVINKYHLSTGSEEADALILGNPSIFFLRSPYGMMIPENDRLALDDDSLGFSLVCMSTYNPGTVGFAFLGSSDDHTFVITKSNGDSYSVSLPSSVLTDLSMGEVYLLQVTATDFIDEVGIEVDKSQILVIDDTEYSGTWKDNDESSPPGFTLDMDNSSLPTVMVYTEGMTPESGGMVCVSLTGPLPQGTTSMNVKMPKE